MKDVKVFLDTNILVYAYDSSSGEKHGKAVEIMRGLWNSGQGMLSTQVLQEFFVSATRKIEKPLDASAAKGIIKDLLKWKTVTIDGEIILEAINLHEQRKYSFWDSAIIASALEGGAGVLYSEDLSDKHTVKGLVIKNPFRPL